MNLSEGQLRLMQTKINNRLRARGRAPISVDGEWGPETAAAVHLVKYLLGFPLDSLDTGPSLWFRKVVQHPSLRPLSYLRAAKDRRVFLDKQEKAVNGSPRGEAVAWAKSQVGTTEHPAGSNRGGKITEWQKDLGAWLIGLAWCGTFCAAVLKHAGVQGVTYRLASVAAIEDDAKAGVAPFRGWSTSPGAVMRGDLVVLFGRGVHVEVVVNVDGNVIHTVGGNTSSGNSGSQSNGGGVFARTRALSDVHGFALVNYPG